MQSNDICNSIFEKIKTCLTYVNGKSFGLHEPFFDINEEKNVVECIRTGWVSYQGKFVTEFESKLADVCGCKYAVAVSSGTVALYVALLISNIKEKEEILIPSLTFVATANAVKHVGAIPHLIDSEYRTLGIDIKKLNRYLGSENFEMRDGYLFNKNTGNKVTAIIPVHIFGHPVDLDNLIISAKKYNLKIIEDCAESLGSMYKDKPVGCTSGIGILSFNGNKIVTTGGGGAILTNDENIAAQLKHLTTTAKLPHRFEFIHDQVGYNFRMPNINAAIGVAQLEKLSKFLNKKRSLAKKYQDIFANNEYCEFFVETSFAKSNYWLNAIVLKAKYLYLKNSLLEILHSSNIFARPFWKPMHFLQPYLNSPRMEDLSVAEDLYNRVILLPSSVFLDD